MDPDNPLENKIPSPPKKTEKEKRIEMIDRQYNPNNPDFVTPVIEETEQTPTDAEYNSKYIHALWHIRNGQLERIHFTFLREELGIDTAYAKQILARLEAEGIIGPADLSGLHELMVGTDQIQKIMEDVPGYKDERNKLTSATGVTPEGKPEASTPPMKPIEEKPFASPTIETKVEKVALTPEQEKQAALDKVAAGVDDLGKRIEAMLAERARTAERIKALEEKVAEEKSEKLSPAEALEKDKEKNPFKYFVIQNMHDTAFSCIYSKTKKAATLEDINSKSGESGREVKFFNFQHPHPTKHHTVLFSSNGFTLQLVNPNEVKNAGVIEKSNPKARYRLVYPNWKHATGDGEYSLEEGEIVLKKKAEEYQKQQLALFEKKVI